MKTSTNFSILRSAACLCVGLSLAGCGGGGGGSGGGSGGGNNREPFTLTGNSLTYSGIQGTASAQQTNTAQLFVRGDNISWQATASVPWIQLSTTSGTAAGPISFAVIPAGLLEGTANGLIRVTDNISMRTENANVTLTVRPLGFSVGPATVILNVDATATSASQTITIADELGGQQPQAAYSWTTSMLRPEFQITPSNGNTASATSAVVSVRPGFLNSLVLDQTTTQLLVTGSGSGSSSSLNRLVTITASVRLPRAHSVDPRIVVPGPTRVVLTGGDFQAEDLPRLRVNGIAPVSVTRLSDRELDVDLGNVSAGRYVFTFDNALGLPRSAAELIVAPRGTYGPGEIVSAGPRQRLLFDSHRGVLYGGNNIAGTIQRFSWNGTAWQELPAISLPFVRDFDFASNARQIYAMDGGSFFVADVTLSNPTAVSIPTPSLNCGSSTIRFEHLIAPNTATVYGTIPSTLCRITGTSQAVFGGGLQYDVLTNSVTEPPNPSDESLWVRGNRVRASADRRYLASETQLWDSRTNTFFYAEVPGTTVPLGNPNQYDTHLDRHGTKVLAADTSILDRSGSVLCTLPTNNAATISSDGARAYSYHHVNGGGGEIRVFTATANGPPGSPAQCASARAPVPIRQNMGLYIQPDPFNVQRIFAMAVAEDDSLLFLSGPARVLAIAIP